MQKIQSVNILGIRGLPASHGGFETFAEHFALFLKERGWDVTVFCQEVGDGERYETEWEGIRRVHIPVKHEGSVGSILFDYKSTRIAVRSEAINLVLGYNTALFGVLYKWHGRQHVMNMDGIEWKRDKWSRPIKFWFYVNERIGSVLADHLIADHPEIKKHLQRHTREGKIAVIPYAADEIVTADESRLAQYGVVANQFFLVIARPEPENSILEIVRAFSSKPRGMKLVVLGSYRSDHQYHKAIKESANESVVFPGAIYDKDTLHALRFFSACYIHGHTVGGTNPSLVEALGAGSPILAHDNKYNRWVAGEGALYFTDQKDCARLLDDIENCAINIEEKRRLIRARKTEEFTWDRVHRAYESLLLKVANG